MEPVRVAPAGIQGSAIAMAAHRPIPPVAAMAMARLPTATGGGMPIRLAKDAGPIAIPTGISGSAPIRSDAVPGQ